MTAKRGRPPKKQENTAPETAKAADFAGNGLPDKQYFRIDEVAYHFSVTDRTVRNWIDHSLLHCIKKPGMVRVPRESILSLERKFAKNSEL